MPKITIREMHRHGKASESYADVLIHYEDRVSWEGWIPTEYRRTGVHLESAEEILAYLMEIAPLLHPSKRKGWEQEQVEFWKTKHKAEVTGGFFKILAKGEWVCTSCGFAGNTNPARRYQDIKELGYTIATDKARFCPTCNAKRAHLLLLILPRGGASGYETWTPELRARIIKVLRNYDAYEGKPVNPGGLLPDHKFPEIRWGHDTMRADLSGLTDKEIKHDFQLLTNQRNQQKREACRTCYQTGKRQFPFGVEFFYEGNENWPGNAPKSGKDAEKGCIGCGWYDLETWRQAQNALNSDPDVKEVRERARTYGLKKEPKGH